MRIKCDHELRVTAQTHRDTQETTILIYHQHRHQDTKKKKYLPQSRGGHLGRKLLRVTDPGGREPPVNQQAIQGWPHHSLVKTVWKQYCVCEAVCGTYRKGLRGQKLRKL